MNFVCPNPDVLFFLDVNVVANAGGNLGGVVDATEWYSTYPDASPGLSVMNKLIDSGAVLATSETMLETLTRALTKHDARDYDALDTDSAEETSWFYSALVRSTGGVVATTAQVNRHVKAAKSAAATHVQGRERIDFEDTSIVASVLASMSVSGAARAVLITDDSGLLNCRGDLLARHILVISTWQYLHMRRDAFAA